MTTSFAIPDGVHLSLESEGRLVVLNQTTGRWHELNRTGADLYRELSRAPDIDHVVNNLVSLHPGVARDRVRDDVERLTADLVRRGLLEPIGGYVRRPAAVLMAAPPKAPAGRHSLLTTVAFLMALVLLRLPFRTSTTMVTTLKRRRGTRETTPQEAARRLAAARRVSRFYPGRVACLELSLTAVLAAVLQRQRIDWCFGFAAEPRAFHSWIETGGTPVTESTDPPIPSTYRRVFRV